ncbi:MAG: ribbon-helix-helix domain-containing protein [Candidatus Kuenenia sp.]|nr:ribbon-helix-helix domain-containing protein [Candidatus Kuenenia sp.]
MKILGGYGMKRVNMYLRPEQIAKIKRLAKKEKVSMTFLVRKAIDNFTRKTP